MAQLQITPKVAEILQSIDQKKQQIASQPLPPEQVLDAMERDFVVDTVYYANKLAGSKLTKTETELALRRGR